jgi:hypothetical protein
LNQSEEERLALDNRPADVAAKLVVHQSGDEVSQDLRLWRDSGSRAFPR